MSYSNPGRAVLHILRTLSIFNLSANAHCTSSLIAFRTLSTVYSIASVTREFSYIVPCPEFSFHIFVATPIRLVRHVYRALR